MKNITDFVEWLGHTIPGDNEEWLICRDAEWEHGRWEWVDDSPSVCPICQAELVVHVPRGTRWLLNYMHYRNKIFPHRIIQPPQGGEAGKKWWVWRKRYFFERPYNGMDWMDLDKIGD